MKNEIAKIGKYPDSDKLEDVRDFAEKVDPDMMGFDGQEVPELCNVETNVV